jgi:protein phosphatase PTC7
MKINNSSWSTILSRTICKNTFSVKNHAFPIQQTSCVKKPALVCKNISFIRFFSTTESHSSVQNHQYRLVTSVSGFPKSQSILNIDQTLNGQIGEDAYFIARHNVQNLNSESSESLSKNVADVIGVADGVAGWRNYGVDPSKFSLQLMQNCENIVLSGLFLSNEPTKLLSDAYSDMKRTRTAFGSSTACLTILNHQNGNMVTANMGDSGLIVVRDGKLIHCTEDQVHCFNTPYQLSIPPPGHMDASTLQDDPQDADVYEFNTQDGDIIMLGTDGVFDNVPIPVLLKELNSLKGNQKDLKSLQECCNSIAFITKKMSRDENSMSPFAKNAILHGYRDERGGKEDDITVLLSVVSTENIGKDS